MVKINEVNQKRKYIKLALILVVAAAVVYAAIFFVVDQRAKSAEKKEFLDNKAQIEEIAKKITAQYPPIEEKHEEYCRYQSAKYDRGDLYCHVNIEIWYENTSIEKANETAVGVSQITDLRLRPEQTRKAKQNVFTPAIESPTSYALNDNQSLIADFGFNPRSCSISLNYDTGTASNKKLLVSISCAKVSKAEYFPVKKY